MNILNTCKAFFVFPFALCLFCLNSYSCDKEGRTGFFPENDLWIPVSYSSNKAGGGKVSKKDFNKIIDEIAELYKSEIEDKGAELVTLKKWENGTVNAYARQVEDIDNNKKWIVAMFGGLARKDEVTEDAFAMVMCHELGHHLAGAPRYSASDWAASEGQSDYWAASKCFKRWADEQSNRRIVRKLKAPKEVQEVCETVHKDKNDQRVCIRSAMAGKSLATLLASLATDPPVIDFSTPNPEVVERTYVRHPEAQCRLDTYYAGAQCNVDFSISTDANDAEIGVCNRRDGYTRGVRPLCWFKPRN